MRNEALFTYWKRPWHKWLILAAAVLQLLSLWLDLRQYRQIVDARVFSAAEMASSYNKFEFVIFQVSAGFDMPVIQ